MYSHRNDTLQTTPDAWLAFLVTEARRSCFEQLDVLIDARNLDYPLQEKLRLLAQPPQQVSLFDHTPEHALTEGPVLLRVELNNAEQQGWLFSFLAHVHGQQRVLVLLSQWPLERLGAHLRHFTQANWNNNTRHGLLHYYDPRQFEAVCNVFDRTQCEHFHAAMDHWYWIDDDGEACDYDGQCWQAHPKQDPLADTTLRPLQLSKKQVELLYHWRDAEEVRIDLDISVKSVKAESKAALRNTLTAAVATLGKEACLADEPLVRDWLVAAFAADRDGR